VFTVAGVGGAERSEEYAELYDDAEARCMNCGLNGLGIGCGYWNMGT